MQTFPVREVDFKAWAHGKVQHLSAVLLALTRDGSMTKTSKTCTSVCQPPDRTTWIIARISNDTWLGSSETNQIQQIILYRMLNASKKYINIPVEPHEAVPEVSKGKVHITQNKHVPIEWFVTTASQSRIWLKLLSDDSNKVCLLCRSTQLHATTSCRSQFATTCGSSYVLQSSTPYWKSTTLYYKVLIQYYSVLQSTTPVLLCTTKYYSSTTLYYKVLLQYYSVLQSTTPVLLCTTKNYSSILLHYKVLLQYYSVLQSTTPVLLSWLIRVTYETLFTMRGTTEVLLQNHRLLRLPRKMTLMIDPHHIWNASYNARSNRDVSPTSPTTAPATKSNTHHWSSSHLKRYLQCAEQHVS